MFKDIKSTALLLVDFQKTFADGSWGDWSNKHSVHNAAKILAFWRQHKFPVIFVQHCNENPSGRFYPGQVGHEIFDELRPACGEIIIKKKVHSSFIGTELDDYLKKNSITGLLICGICTEHCVSTTTRMSYDLGYQTYLLEDACNAFGYSLSDDVCFSPKQIHQMHVASLKDEFATIVQTHQIIQ